MLKLLTIITESIMEPVLIDWLATHQILHYSCTSISGSGNQGKRNASMQELANIKFEIITSEIKAIPIMKALKDEFFQDYAMIAYLAEVQVMRSDKFGKP